MADTFDLWISVKNTLGFGVTHPKGRMNAKPVRIYLGGALGRAMGRSEWELFVSSPAEAIRAIDANLKGKLRQYLAREGRERYYSIAIHSKDNLLDKEEISRPSGRNDIYILPTIKGANSGVGKIITGVLLIVAAVLLSPYTGGTSLSWIPGALGTVGASLVIGGITQLLTPTPNFNQNSEGDSRGSNIFEGNATTVSQGGAVGLIYGRMLVTPMPISLSITSYDQSSVTSFGGGGYDVVSNDEGNFVEYVPTPPDPFSNLPESTG